MNNSQRPRMDGYWPFGALSFIVHCSFIILLMPGIGRAAITATGSASSGTASGADLTLSGHTVPSGTDILVCGLFIRAMPVGGDVSAVTWNTSENLTKLRSDPSDLSGVSAGSQLWYLVNPTATTADVLFDVNDANAPGRIVGGCFQYDGVDIASPWEASNGTTGNGNSSSVSLATSSDNAWLVDVGGQRSTTSRTPDTGQPQRWQASSGGPNAAGSSSDKDAGTAGSGKTMGWSWGGGAQDFAHSVGAMTPAAAPAGQPPLRRVIVLP